MSYLKDLKLILTLQVNQFLINMEKRIFALLRGLLIVLSKETASKIVRTGRMRSIWIFSSIFIQRNRCINLLPSSPPLPSPPLPPPAPNTVFIHILQGHKLVLVRGGGRICHYFDTELPPASINTLLCTVSRSFGPTSNILQGKWYRLSNTILQFGTETILSANVPQYLSIKGVFTWNYYFSRIYTVFFFLGGGG